MGFLKLLGRVLIITALVSSAYHHLERPSHSVEEFKANYQTIDQLSNTYLKYDIPLDNTNWVLGSRIFGLFEALVALLIIFGDSLGGLLYVLSIGFQIFFLVWPRVVSKTLAHWSFGQLEEISHLVSLLGIGLILSCASYGKNQAKSSTK